ncbi:hypothetical protein [Natribacillus halophilus]|uniref:Uncharacterized protein n=1 Tax=Natribacillus halophilus TaxID=549003 RepID=A0A1G8RPF8_9BACI|nr:hypothetical protein [Natribacillus halophilus]SDJ18836.1 hypothetical protein SAMN04488123_11944 [Natribacillus halophilus]
MANHERYYVRGNTADGLIDYFPSNLNGEKVIALEHPSETLKTAVMKQLINKLEKNDPLEILLSPHGYDYLDGLIIREKAITFVTDTVQTKGTLEEAFDLGTYVPASLSNDFLEADNKYQDKKQSAYSDFATGLRIHDDLEDIYIAEMDVAKAETLTETFIVKLLQDVQKKGRTAHEYHRLFGTNTSDGIVNEVPHLKGKFSNVYYIKGRAGTGKSTFMKKIGEACKQHGFDVEFYHCSFDPGSIDMLIVRDLDFCMFDSTDPHEFFPDRETEVIVDLYKEAVTPGTDEKYADEINQVNGAYKAYMKKGLKHLVAAGTYLEIMEDQFTFDETQVSAITEDLMAYIQS